MLSRYNKQRQNMSISGIHVEQLYNVWENGFKPVPPKGHTYRCGFLRKNAKFSNINCDFISCFICEKQPDQYVNINLKLDTCSLKTTRYLYAVLYDCLCVI